MGDEYSSFGRITLECQINVRNVANRSKQTIVQCEKSF